MVDNLIKQVLGNDHTYKQYKLMVNTIYNYMTSLRILPLSENYILLQASDMHVNDELALYALLIQL